jgi:hypothetical protein
VIKLIQKLDKRETHPSYLDFVLQKSIEDLRRENKKRLDFETIEKYFGYLTKAKDSLKAVYTIMHIPKLKDTGIYLLFVLKKAGEGVIDFDTLDENARADSDFIKAELVKNFTLSGAEVDEPELKIPEVSGTGLYDLVKESNFKIESEENESITEQFSGMEMYNEEHTKQIIEDEISEEEFELIVNEDSEDDALELIETDDNEKNNSPLKDLGGEPTNDPDDISQEYAQTIIDETPIDTVILEDNSTKTIDSDFNEIYDSDDVIREGMIEEKIDTDDEEKDELLEEKNTEEYKAEESSPIEEPIGENLEEQNKPEEQGESLEIPGENPGVLEDEPVIENDEYKDYESTLLEVNELLGDYFLDIESVTEGKSSRDGEHVLFGKIAELCYIIQERSERMSFSIISGIYNNIGGIFRKYVSSNARPLPGDIEKFRSGVRVVEGLIMGYEMEEADDIISSLYNLRKSLEDSKKELPPVNYKEGSLEEKAEENILNSELKKDEQGQEIITKEVAYSGNQSSHKLKEKYSNAELRECFKQMKSQILDLERTFNALDEIEGDYQNYEGLRKLSTTFNNLKEIIRQANILELTDVAKLSEASYVFIKFIQNYRMNPFDEDVREIFKYIIYNFKAASLDKPNEDMERFISYLNDPVKIFTQKNKK